MTHEQLVEAVAKAYEDHGSHRFQGFMYGRRHVIRDLFKPDNEQRVWTIERPDSGAGEAGYEAAHAEMMRELELIRFRAVLATIARALETVTPEMAEVWERATWLPDGKSASDYTDDEANRLCCQYEWTAMLRASAINQEKQS